MLPRVLFLLNPALPGLELNLPLAFEPWRQSLKRVIYFYFLRNGPQTDRIYQQISLISPSLNQSC